MRSASYVGLSTLTAAAWLAACSSSPPSEDRAERAGSVRQAAGGTAPNDPADDCDEGRPDSLPDFAKKCDAAIGATVPDFDCDDGSEVPETHLTGEGYPNQTCDRPNVLVGVCDPGSRFQVLKNDGNIMTVAHCRKQGKGSGKYGDIAVIQYNKTNGATCFYQALGTLPAKVTAPSKGNGGDNFPWLTPAATAGINCVGCHDNGPFIRSPYIAQLMDDPEASGAGNVLPGSHDATWNKTLPYKFVGSDFQSWKVYEVSVDGVGSACSTCHRMGMSATQGQFNEQIGTAQRMGPFATAATQPNKNAHSDESPIWMKPGQVHYNADVETDAKKVASCAEAIANYGNDPASAPAPPPECHVAQYGQGDTCRGGPKRVIINGATQAPVGEGRVDTTEPVSECAEGQDCPIAFCYWRTLHGSFWQSTDSSIPVADPAYRGSFLRIFAEGGAWKTRAFVDATPGAKAPPGGTVECSRFNEIKTVSEPDNCTMQTFSISDPDGTHLTDSKIMKPAGQWLDLLTGFIGNVAQTNVATTHKPDFLRILESGGNALLAQEHVKPVAPLTAGPLKGEAYSTRCGTWSPEYAVKNLFTAGDSQLVPPEQAKDVRCFISGITGAWSSTRNDGWVQPFAEIYVGVSKDIRFRVAPTSGSDRVGAYASCIKLK